MIEIIVLAETAVLIIIVIAVVIRAIIQKQSILGIPPIPVFYFILAKLFAAINLIFLIFRVFNININGNLFRSALTDWIAVVLLAAGVLIVSVSSFRLNKDLIFGLSTSREHALQTKGVYSISRHPFYSGFLAILFSSCLLNSNIINIISFIGAWTIHHIIMIKEEEHLITKYGDEYKDYLENTGRYFTFRKHKIKQLTKA